MTYITLVAVIAILILQLPGVMPASSVGGPMTEALAFLIASPTFGIYEAWSKQRGVLGWIVSIVASIAGAIVGIVFGSTLMDTIHGQLHLQGSLVQTQHPFLYISAAGMMLLTLLGSWLALWLVNRLR